MYGSSDLRVARSVRELITIQAVVKRSFGCDDEDDPELLSCEPTMLSASSGVMLGILSRTSRGARLMLIRPSTEEPSLSVSASRTFSAFACRSEALSLQGLGNGLLALSTTAETLAPNSSYNDLICVLPPPLISMPATIVGGGALPAPLALAPELEEDFCPPPDFDPLDAPPPMPEPDCPLPPMPPVLPPPDEPDLPPPDVPVPPPPPPPPRLP